MSQHSSRSPEYKRLRPLVLKRDGYTCIYCGNEANTVDHVHPVSKGGTDTMDNMVAACSDCNNFKNDRLQIRTNYYNKRWVSKL